RRLLPVPLRASEHRRALRAGPARNPRRGGHRARPQLARELDREGTGVGLLPPHRRGQARPVPVPPGDGRAGRLLALRPGHGRRGGRLARLRGRGHRPHLGDPEGGPPRRSQRGRLPVHERAGHTRPVQPAAPALVARHGRGLQAAPGHPAGPAALDPVRLLEPAVPAARPHVHGVLHPGPAACPVRLLLDRGADDARADTHGHGDELPDVLRRQEDVRRARPARAPQPQRLPDLLPRLQPDHAADMRPRLLRGDPQPEEDLGHEVRAACAFLLLALAGAAAFAAGDDASSSGAGAALYVSKDNENFYTQRVAAEYLPAFRHGDSLTGVRYTEHYYEQNDWSRHGEQVTLVHRDIDPATANGWQLDAGAFQQGGHAMLTLDGNFRKPLASSTALELFVDREWVETAPALDRGVHFTFAGGGLEQGLGAHVTV